MMTLNFRLIIELFLVFVFTIMPLPEIVLEFRPPWILLFVLYIQFFLPNYFSITVLFFLGLCIDVLLSTVLGEHAFALLLTTWFAAGKVRRFCFFSLIQQMVLIGVFCLTYQLIIYCIESFLGYHTGLMALAGIVVLSVFLWPWVRILADGTLLVSSNRGSLPLS